ncbi:PucR-like helix-turn-helix protein [Kribbella sp. VKM Ac-2527]|uniref:PucR-like helix-turn-helix protein n=1 Tax=Kribbella caucasensis TaxID=2512215 RepID=A0A4R6KNY4_9ACTN|nr:helix-turn-helix domain-containing protein [Kribbella sp. VKM Ac-2527]TDO51279.1 PucR-like helix-turn-helix protein [Kribbella sp. VKM Ac-2527]
MHDETPQLFTTALTPIALPLGAQPLADADPRPIQAVTIVDGATLTCPPDAVVLGVGVQSSAVLALVREAVRVRASAVVVGRAVDPGKAAAALAAEHGTTILRLADGVTWQRAATAIASLLQGVRRPVSGIQALDEVPDGDLYALADVICDLIDAPVTIEDRNTHVLAFSARQDEADFVRIDSILQRMRPHDYVETSMDAVLSSPIPVYLPASRTADGRDVMPRVAVAVRDGMHLFGTIWAVVPGPLPAEQERLLTEAARVAEHHLRQATAQEDTSYLEDRVSALLDGRADAPEAASSLGVGTPALVICVETSGSDVPAPAGDLAGYLTRLAWRNRICSALTMHLQGAGIPAVAASVAHRVYAIASLVQHAETEILAACTQFNGLVGTRTPVYVGLGRPALSVEDFRRSREDADVAARTLRHVGGPRRVASVSDLLVDSLFVELKGKVEAGERGPSGAYERLLAYDRNRGARLVETLCAWLDAFGDVTTAAGSCGVHPNTFRYRLMRVEEIGEVDLTDPEERFALNFQRRLFRAG